MNLLENFHEEVNLVDITDQNHLKMATNDNNEDKTNGNSGEKQFS